MEEESKRAQGPVRVVHERGKQAGRQTEGQNREETRGREEAREARKTREEQEARE